MLTAQCDAAMTPLDDVSVCRRPFYPILSPFETFASFLYFTSFMCTARETSAAEVDFPPPS